MNFKIISPITNIEAIAVGNGIRDIERLRKMYGIGRWRKLKGVATIRLWNGSVRLAELHWYEAQKLFGLRKYERRFKICRLYQ